MLGVWDEPNVWARGHRDGITGVVVSYKVTRQNVPPAPLIGPDKTVRNISDPRYFA